MFKSRVPLLLVQKEQLERRKIPQRLLADETGISKNTICRWMSRAKTMPRLDGVTVAALCAYFECTIDDLVDIEA